MNVEPHEVGAERNRVIVIDDVLQNAWRAVDIAAAIAPFAPERAFAYPGLRHNLTPDHQAGAAYVRALVEASGPSILAAYGAPSLNIVAASFSIVTQSPAELKSAQRLPHTDSYDANFVALLHHLHNVPGTGTGFYRHRRTGFETVSEARREALEAGWAEDWAEYGEPKQAFFADSDPRYEKIFQVEGRFNRLVIYPGSLFHSGLIPPDFPFDPNPRSGRLTGNIFVTLTLGSHA
jgi:hypothetical protein